MLEVKNYINGQWISAASGRMSEVLNPATCEVIAKAPYSGLKDVEMAVEAANHSFYKTREWRNMTADERAAVLYKIADKIEERAAEFALCDTTNQGKPLAEAELDVADSANVFRYYAGLITKPASPDGNHAERDHIPTASCCARYRDWDWAQQTAARGCRDASDDGTAPRIQPSQQYGPYG